MTDYCCDEWLRHWHLYHCYATDGTLLYVGQTSESTTRIYLHGHYSKSHWFHHCARVVFSGHFTSASAARTAERAEISRLRPVFNKHHNPEPTPWTPPDEITTPYGAMPEITFTATERAA